MRWAALLPVIAARSMRVRTGDHPRGHTNGGALARHWRPAALVAVAAVAVLPASGVQRDSHPPQGPETAAAITARPGVEQVEPLGGKRYPPRYDTLDYELNQLVARYEGRDAAPGTPAMDGDARVAILVLLAPARAGDVAAYLRENGVALPAPATGADYLAAAVPLSALADLAGRPGVHLVMAEPSIQRYDAGVAPHGADFWHDPGWDGGNGNDDDDTNDGSNVKIGILDTGFIAYDNGRPPFASPRYLPDPKGVLCFIQDSPNVYITTDSITRCSLINFFAGDEHGSLVTQLVYDIAPGADYYLARIALASQFEQAITWFIDQGVDVISTSLGKRWEGPGDGTSPYSNTWISQVARAVDAGIFVAVASGNSDTSSWFGTFRDSDNDDIMEWNESGDECNMAQFEPSTSYNIRVRWEDTWNGASDDLDISLRRGLSGGTTDYMSENVQDGEARQDPIENISLKPDEGVSYCLVIEQQSGATPDWVQVIIESEATEPEMEHWTRGYSLGSPAETTSPGAVTVGAAPVDNTTTIQDTGGRGPLPASDVVKPDVVGVDKIPLRGLYSAISPGGTYIREGTSLATPHVAALAALVKQRNPTFTPAQIATYLKDNALPRGEPDPNNTWGHGLAFLPYIGPVITGDPRIGVTLTANTDAVDDVDGVPDSPTFTYQWIRVASGGTEANISTATSATYTPVQADAGSTLKVKVSFTDSGTNAEEQTSRASLKVVPAANTAATGKPTISGPVPLRVTHTLTASTSAIRDTDGVTGVTYKYQWVLVDSGTDTDISGATESSYVLETADEGKKVKVKVSFTDNNRNAETVVSDESAVVASAPNRPPTFSDTRASREVLENTPAGEDIGTPITATEFDSGDTLTYSIRNGSTVFEIDASSGQLQTLGALNYEGTRSYSVVVEVTDNKDIDGMADTVIDDTIAVTINVTNVDEPAIISGPQTVDWNENTAGTIATYTATDPDPADQAFLTLADTGDAGFFDFSNGRLSFKSTRLPDFEGPKTTYYIELGAADDPLATDNFDTTYAVTINILDLNEPPVVMRRSGTGAFSIEENSGTTVGSFDADDPENDDVTWTLASGGDFRFFEIDETGGALSFKESEFNENEIPDYESTGLGNDKAYSVTVRATEADDGDPQTSELTGRLAVTVRITDVNEPPVITGNQSPSVEENTTAVATYRATDPEGVAVTWSLQGGAGRFTISSAGALAFTNTTPPNYEDQTEHAVTVLASDGTNTADYPVSVAVTNVNERAMLGLSSPQPQVEAAFTATLTDADIVQSTTWKWERSTSPGGGWQLISGATADSYTPIVGDINYYLRATATYRDGYSPDTDKSISAVSRNRVEAKPPVNTAPEFPAGTPRRSVPENAGDNATVGLPVVANDAENASQLTYTLTGGSDLFTIDGSSGQIRVRTQGTLDHETAPSHTVTVTVTDPATAFDTVEVTIEVTDVNEPPNARADDATTFEDTAVPIDVLGNDTDPDDGHTLTVQSTSRPSSGGVMVESSTQMLIYTPAENVHGTFTFTYTASDGTFTSASALVTITVDPVNDSPEFASPPPALRVSESAVGGDIVGAVTATDIDAGDTLTYSLSGTDAFAFEIDPVSGQITVRGGVDIAVQDTYEVTVEADDGSNEANATARVDVTITVVAGPVVPPPTSGGGGGFGGGGGGGGGGPSGPSPSEIDFEWTVKRDIEELDSGNDWPTGLWSDGATLWILENGQGADDDVYAYDPRTGERLEEREFTLADTNRAPRGIWSDRETVWVSDSGRERLFAYGLASGEREESREVELAERNSDARGIWSDEETMWVLDGRADALFAYDLATGDLLAEYGLASRNGDPHGIWSDRVTVWVSDHGAKRLFAYRLPARPEAPAAEDAEAAPLESVRDEEFTELSGASNNSPRGIWSDGDFMYVADESDDRVYTYNMPDALDARLASLSLSGVEIGEFDAGTTEYEGTPAEGVAETTVEASALQRRTDVAIDPPDTAVDTAGHQVSLAGTGEITVTVTSADGTRTKVYRVTLALPPAELALTPDWTAIEWPGVDAIAIAEAGLPDAVVAVYVWDEESGSWLGYFPGLEDVSGLNTLTTLNTGATYWIAVSEPVTWTITTGESEGS